MKRGAQASGVDVVGRAPVQHLAAPVLNVMGGGGGDVARRRLCHDGWVSARHQADGGQDSVKGRDEQVDSTSFAGRRPQRHIGECAAPEIKFLPMHGVRGQCILGTVSQINH
jgi:hypothetical protein